MELAHTFSGSGAYLLDLQIAATVSNAGIPFLIPAADGAGVVQGTTGGAVDFVGMGLDASRTYVTAQQTDGTSAERTVQVVCNPDAVWLALMSGGATEGTALTLYDVTTASATGLVVTTGDDWTSPQFDEGMVWDYDGANVGQARKITLTSATAATVTVAFNNDTVVGNNFLRAPYTPLQGVTVQLTGSLTQADASIAVGTGAGYKPVKLILNNVAQAGRTNSYVLFTATDHVFGARPT